MINAETLALTARLAKIWQQDQEPMDFTVPLMLFNNPFYHGTMKLRIPELVISTNISQILLQGKFI